MDRARRDGWERAIDGFAGGLENADLHGIAEQELDELLDSLETSALPTEAFDNFLGKLVRLTTGMPGREVALNKAPMMPLYAEMSRR